MTSRRPWLIVTMPGRSAPECREQALVAARSGADLAEVRVDRWPVRERPHLRTLFPSPLPLVATYRSRREGGEGADEGEERTQVFAELSRLPFWAIDRERDRDLAPGSENLSPFILSSHLPEGTPASVVRERLFETTGDPRFVKVVLPARLSTALELLETAIPSRSASSYVLHTTGASGGLFRALAAPLGLAAVYAALPSEARESPVEPSQIPVDRLRAFLEGPSHAPLFALLGRSVQRSRSPALMSRWMRALGDSGLYLTLDVGDETELGEAISQLPKRGFRGFNVTQPWKRAALELADTSGPGADPCGCANVLTVSPNGEIEASNTDLAATLRRLEEMRAARDWDGDTLVVVGTGGAARASLAAGRSLGATLHLLARNRTALAALSEEFGARPEAGPPDRPASLLINATSMGVMGSGSPGVQLEPWIGPGTHVLDFVYGPDEPWLSQLTASRGGVYEDGSRLLVYQAAETYEIWQGRIVPEELLRDACGDPP